MRDLARLLLGVALVASVGCVGGDGDAVEDTGGEQAALPGTMQDERHVEASASPTDSTQDKACEDEVSTCFRYPFDVGTDARVQAHLDWANATNDFDLHVVTPGGERVASSTAGPLETSEMIDAEIPEGSYEIVVVAWIVSEDTYNLEAHFGYA